MSILNPNMKKVLNELKIETGRNSKEQSSDKAFNDFAKQKQFKQSYLKQQGCSSTKHQTHAESAPQTTTNRGKLTRSYQSRQCKILIDFFLE